MYAQEYDLVVIGGGLSGAALARDAAGRGLSVYLCDAGDLAGGASSAAGGLVRRALDNLVPPDFAALRANAAECANLVAAAPHVVRPLTMLVPHHERQWPRWALSLGLRAADRVAGTRGPTPRRVALGMTTHGPLKPAFQVAYALADCVVDDARLTVLNALDAATHGASVNPRVRCVVAEREGRRWRLALEHDGGGLPFTIMARALVNATGAEVGAINDHVIHTRGRLATRVARESFILVRRRLARGRAFALPTADGPVVYALPYGRDLMAIGPCRREIADPCNPRVAASEVGYLLDAANRYFAVPLAARDVVAGFAAVTARPAAGTAPWATVVDAPPHQAPLVSVVGGTLATHRRLAEAAVNELAAFLRVGPAWTTGAVLPGGGFPAGGTTALARALVGAYRFLPQSHAFRLARTYGTRAHMILNGARAAGDLGKRFVGDLTEAEVSYLQTEEWAESAEDVLWRRTGLGFAASTAEMATLGRWFGRHLAGARVASPAA